MVFIYMKLLEIIENIVIENSRVLWTDDKVKNEIDKYDSINDFKENNPRLFALLRSKGLVDKFFPDRSGERRRVKWTDEKIKSEAEKYDSIDELRRNNNLVYLALRKEGLLDKYFPNQDKKDKWDEESLRKEVEKYDSVTDLLKDNPKLYSIIHYKGLSKTLFPKRKVKWTDDAIKNEAEKYGSVGELRKNNLALYSTLRNKGLIDKFFPGGGKVGPYVKWTDEVLKKESEKYNSRTEMWKNSPSAYSIASKKGLIDAKTH